MGGRPDMEASSARTGDRAPVAGIRVAAASDEACRRDGASFGRHLDELGLAEYVRTEHRRIGARHHVSFTLEPGLLAELGPDRDTTALCERFALATDDDDDELARETLLALLASPIAFEYPSYAELASALRIRRNVVRAASRTALAFDTEHAERPADYWTYHDGRGFVLNEDKSLVEALRMTTQPDRSGALYSFSCYRATEYVMLLAIAEELLVSNPACYDHLERLWRSRAIMADEFHEVFLDEVGSTESPLPLRFFVPGDRLWFRNPDEPSSNVPGFEGSWVFYLGKGLFANFWKRDQPFTLVGKCVEIYHWRHGTFCDAGGTLRMDEREVDRLVAQTMRDPAAVRRILERMMRPRDPRLVYADGGCIDASLECARWVRPDTCRLAVPMA